MPTRPLRASPSFHYWVIFCGEYHCAKLNWDWGLSKFRNKKRRSDRLIPALRLVSIRADFFGLLGIHELILLYMLLKTQWLWKRYSMDLVPSQARWYQPEMWIYLPTRKLEYTESLVIGQALLNIHQVYQIRPVWPATFTLRAINLFYFLSSNPRLSLCRLTSPMLKRVRIREILALIW
jgi:hypothetical protein